MGHTLSLPSPVSSEHPGEKRELLTSHIPSEVLSIRGSSRNLSTSLPSSPFSIITVTSDCSLSDTLESSPLQSSPLSRRLISYPTMNRMSEHLSRDNNNLEYNSDSDNVDEVSHRSETPQVEEVRPRQLQLPIQKNRFVTWIDHGSELDEQHYPLYPNGNTVFVKRAEDQITNFSTGMATIAWTGFFYFYSFSFGFVAYKVVVYKPQIHVGYKSVDYKPQIHVFCAVI